MINKGLYSSYSVEWETPKDFYNKLNEEFNFDLDPCCNNLNAKCKNYYAKNGLERPWFGTVFMNPPYGKEITKWVERAYKESKRGVTVVCLIPSRTDTRWWHRYVMKADEIRFIKGRLKFGDAKNSAPFPSALVVFRGKYA